jgi:hypothetical protein
MGMWCCNKNCVVRETVGSLVEMVLLPFSLKVIWN